MSNRLNILNIWVDPIDMDGALIKIAGFVKRSDHPNSIFAANPEKNYSVPLDDKLYEIFKNADLIIPDGIGVVLAARLLHGAKIGRVPGVELMERICRLSAENGFRIFLYGSSEEINRQAEGILKDRYKGLIVAGRSSGFVKDEQMPELIKTINESKADILFIGLGSPRQEKWYATYRDQLSNVKVCQGIGGTLDAITGNVKRAPEIWCRLNLEWLYRLLKEPSRIKRQKVLPVFALEVLIEKFRQIFRLQKKDGSITVQKTIPAGKVS